MPFYLYRISQKENKEYDTFDSAVVVAVDEASAKLIHPSYGKYDPEEQDEFKRWDYTWSCWASHPDKVEAVYVGVAADNLRDGYVVCYSFNAG